jgi:signal transduction histidine kinase
MIHIAAYLPKIFLPTGTGQTTTEAVRLPTVTRRLTILVLVAVLPLLAYSAFMIVRYAQDQRWQYDQQLQATAHATSLAIDAATSRQIAILTTLRNSRELKSHDWQAFYDLAKDSVADQPGVRINLYDPTGQFILSTLAAYGAALPMSGDPGSILNVVETKQLLVSDLVVSAISNAYVISVFIPVVEYGAVAYVLGIAFPPSDIARILHGQISLEHGTATVVGRDGKVIARSRNEALFVGHPATTDFMRVTQSDQGLYEIPNLEGVWNRGAFAKSALAGWTISLAVNNAAFDAPLRRSLWIFGGGGGLFLAIALLLAFGFGRNFVQSVASLTAMAQALGRGDRLPPKRFALRELQMIAAQMIVAAESLQRHNAERANLLATLTASKEHLEGANRELDTFAFSVSHDLRSPLRAIDGFSQVLQEDYAEKLDTEAQRLIQIIRDGVGKMARLIEDILAFSRAARREMATSVIDMTELVQATLRDLAPAMTGRTIEVNVAPLPQMRGDREMMQRVWVNLLDNAIKFTARTANARIEVGSYAEAEATVYFVKDNGAGFDMASVDKLFGVFQRLHEPEDFPGTGAGLAIVKRIVNRHGGRVWAEGKVGEGATFYFALPSQVPAYV